jgi:hypothetical protein
MGSRANPDTVENRLISFPCVEIELRPSSPHFVAIPTVLSRFLALFSMGKMIKRVSQVFLKVLPVSRRHDQSRNRVQKG